ncbi:MAG: BNR-4 repeat-containing protein [Saprospiraceae bacterium]|nr:BNR-4 repeat-containing protein [Saprospiraceae bacterium]
MNSNRSSGLIIGMLILVFPFIVWGQPNLTGQKFTGYRGIWFELNQKFPYGDKYSGGLGTYTAKHIPLAIYAPEVDKTFFVYGGTTEADQRHLLCMIGSYDHRSGMVSRPVVVYDKQGVNDPHDDPSLSIDDQGYLWVFVSGRGQKRPGFIFKSEQPFDISSFVQVLESEMTYPQPWFIEGKGYVYLFTKYTGVRELYFRTSPDGMNWSEDFKLAGIKEKSTERSGHYQVSGRIGNKVATFFNRHPDGNVDKRTDLYYLQTEDFGKTWTNIHGQIMQLPLEDVHNRAQVVDYQKEGKNVYLKDLKFDPEGNPIALYITSKGHEPGPANDPREWRLCRWNGSQWIHSIITTSDHNYDMGSLILDGVKWYVVAPTTDGPQKYGTGGEIDIWFSRNKGKKWKLRRKVTRFSQSNHSYMRSVLYGKAPFQYFWADGDADHQSISHLYFGDLQGNTWILPYDMQEAEEKPIKVDLNHPRKP